MSFVFYDTETTGKETFFDQILQFAAIRTDNDLKELDRFEIRSRILPHIVPAPRAMYVTGVSIGQITDPGLPSHYQMVRQIRAKLIEWSPSTFIGYNSVEFDEDLLRQALYKTLHQPYLTNSNGNARSDVLKMVHAATVFAPGVLNIPVKDDGKPVFKLDRLAPANGFNHANAHDALADVEATIFIAQILMNQAPDVWNAFMKFCKKSSVIDFIETEPVFCVAEFYYNRPFVFLVTAIGANEKNTGERYVYDLSVPLGALRVLSDAELTKTLAKSPKAVRRLKANASPIIFGADAAPDGCKGKECGIEELTARAEELSRDEGFRKRLIACLEASKQEYPPSAHVEKQIYDGLFNEDSALMEKFHEVDWIERPAIVEKFKDARLKTIGQHLIYLEQPALLSKKVCSEYARRAALHMLGEDPEVGWLILPQALAEMETVMAEADDVQKQVLQQHRSYLMELNDQASKLLGNVQRPEQVA